MILKVCIDLRKFIIKNILILGIYYQAKTMEANCDGSP